MKLPEDVPTVGESFSKQGYATSLVGKAHFQPLVSREEAPSIESQPTLRDLDFWRDFHGPWYGFDHIETARMHTDEAHVGGHYALWMEEKGLTQWQDYFQDYPPNPEAPQREHRWDLPEEYHYNVWTAEKTIESIKQAADSDQPFFCWSSFHDPHPPYLVPSPWSDMYDPKEMQIGQHQLGEFDDKPPHFAMTQDPNADWSVYQETPFANHGLNYQVTDPDQARKNMAVYYGMVSFMDQQIGRILDALDEQGLADNTIVVFTTDHGHFLGQHGLWQKACHLYEDLLRLPFLVRWPGQIPAGVTNQAMQGLIDLPSTFLRAAGIKIPGQMQGVDQLDVWRGDSEQARNNIICEHRHQPTEFHLRTFITEQYKMTVYRDQPYGELYDLKNDPDEMINHWDDPEFASIKATLLHQFINAELCREPTRQPRIAHA